MFERTVTCKIEDAIFKGDDLNNNFSKKGINGSLYFNKPKTFTIYRIPPFKRPRGRYIF